MIQLDDNTKQTQLYKSYVELVKFLHSSDLDCVMDSCATDLEELFETYRELISKNPL